MLAAVRSRPLHGCPAFGRRRYCLEGQETNHVTTVASEDHLLACFGELHQFGELPFGLADGRSHGDFHLDQLLVQVKLGVPLSKLW